MLRKWYAIAIGFGLSTCACVVVVKNNGLPTAANLTSGITNRLVVSPRPNNVQPLLLSVTSPQVTAQAANLKSVSPAILEPGVYKTEPFGGIVIVPNRNIDASIAFPAPEIASAMPMLKPELRFIPLDPSK